MLCLEVVGIMKKWNALVKIGWVLCLCLFLMEYLHPSAIGVRANYSLGKEYSSLDNAPSCLQKSNNLAWVRGDHDHPADNGRILFGGHRIEHKSIVHAMIWLFPIPIIRAFTKFKFEPIQDFLFDHPPCEKIYHPPRRPFLLLLV